MFFNPTATNITTMLFVAITVWIVHMRLRRPIDTNWPLFYYLGVVAYTKTFQDVLNPNLVFVAVVCGLLLRFEFMGGAVLNTVRAVELAMLGYFVYQWLALVFYF